MKSGVNISLKLFDIETNINGMTLLNPFWNTNNWINPEFGHIHTSKFMFIFISYFSWKTTTIPFSCINFLSLVHFQYAQTNTNSLIQSSVSFLGFASSIYSICPLNSFKVCSKLMNNLWIDWNRLSFNECWEKNFLRRKDNVMGKLNDVCVPLDWLICIM